MIIDSRNTRKLLILLLISFCCDRMDITWNLNKRPEIVTDIVEVINGVSVRCGGNIINDGGSEIKERGILYSLNNNPALDDSVIVCGSGKGPFAIKVTGLKPGTKYYLKAYAINEVGTGYGDAVDFTTVPYSMITTPVSLVTYTTARSGGNISSDGGEQITSRGVCWSQSANPTINASKTTDGKGKGSFTSNISGLTPGTTYFLRAYAINSIGTIYGNELTFTTLKVTLPIVNTITASTVTPYSIKTGGYFDSDGGSNITSKGVCWNTTGAPTIADDRTNDGTGSGIYSSLLTGLQPVTKYYFRAYATNSIGTAYGNQLYVTTYDNLPTLTTVEASSVTSNSAKTGGNITHEGDSRVIARGVCWSTTANPTIENSKTNDGSGTGLFVSNITGLNSGVTYYVRAYATNSVGTNYGNQQIFTTKANLATLTTTTVTSITSTTAVSGGNISNDGGAQVTLRGVCWSTSTNPTTANSKTENGQGTGVFTSNLTGLKPGSYYYLRAYAINNQGTAYGNLISFTTNPVLPSITTTTVTSITETTATTGGNITYDGGATVTARGVCWSTSPNPTTANSKTINGTGTGFFISNITGLSSGIIYYVRAYASNSAGTTYGNQEIFTTKANFAVLTTSAVTSVTGTTAVSGGNITGDGGSPVTLRGICWSITPNPTTADSKTINGAGTGIFISNITGLSPMTDYYIRAYAVNSAGTAYGNQVSFKTSALLPSLTTQKVSDVTFTTAVSGGYISNDGGAPVTVRGVCWSSSPNPTIANNKTNDGTGTGSFASNITGLNFGVTYYVRAYATNVAGTGYGNQEEFTTNPVGSVIKASYISMTVPEPTGGKWIWGKKVVVGETYSTVLAGNVNNYFIPWCVASACCSNSAYNGMSISLHTIITDTNYRLFITGGLSGGAYFTDGSIEIPSGWVIDSVRNLSNTDYNILNNKIHFHAGTSLTGCPCSDCGRANLSFYIRKTD